MTNFENLRNKTRTFEGMLEMLSAAWDTSGCFLDGLEGAEIECPLDCTCRTCIETWLSSEYKGSEKEGKA